jgi:hypothetical protein
MDLDVAGVRISQNLVVGGGVGVWLQPELSVVSNGVALGQTSRLGGFGGPTAQPATPGAAFHAEARWEQSNWFLGFRVGAKTSGLKDLQPIAPSVDSVALLGLLLK